MRAAAPIKVRNAQRKVRVNLGALRDFGARALHLCLTRQAESETDLRRVAEMSVVLVSDRRMAALHRDFMNLAGATDVITFQHGEIFVSVETALRNAAEFGTSLHHEIQLYIVHGFLHLDGFDDTTRSASLAMQAAQEQIFSAARPASI